MKVSSSNKAEKNTLVSDNHNLFLLVVLFTLNLVAGTTEGVNRPSVQEKCEYENINTNKETLPRFACLTAWHSPINTMPLKHLPILKGI